MPKISKFGGPTNFGLNETAAGFVEPELSPPADWVRPADAEDEALAVPENDGSAVTERTEPSSDAKVDLPFNPGDYSVKDVVAALVDLDPADRAAVIEAERADRGRAGILNAAD